MDVHHHPHLPHHKRKFTDYLIEFFMLFLAVLLGFLAENLRENRSNRETEKQYVESLIRNLQDDTAGINTAIRENQMKMKNLQNLMALAPASFADPDNRKELYLYSGKSIGFYSVFKSNDATMMQLKNAGLRLLQRDHVADSIAQYDVIVKAIYGAEEIYTRAVDAGLQVAQQTLDYTVYYDTSFYRSAAFTNKPLPFLVNDSLSLKRFFNSVDYEIGSTRNYIENLQQKLPFAERLIVYLKNEYAIE